MVSVHKVYSHLHPSHMIVFIADQTQLVAPDKHLHHPQKYVHMHAAGQDSREGSPSALQLLMAEEAARAGTEHDRAHAMQQGTTMIIIWNKLQRQVHISVTICERISVYREDNETNHSITIFAAGVLYMHTANLDIAKFAANSFGQIVSPKFTRSNHES